MAISLNESETGDKGEVFRDVHLKSILKSFLAYHPLKETRVIRDFLKQAELNNPDGRPLSYTSDYEGDLIYSLIKDGELSRCLETGFATGSTALYMLFAAEEFDGNVLSIDIADPLPNDIGKRNVAQAGFGERHQLIEQNSNQVIPKLFLAGQTFVYIDGWKSFDHLAFELYMIDHMLSKGGIILFDDTYMPGVRQSIRLLQRYYAYEEIDYEKYGQGWCLRILQTLTVKSMFRPYRALRKTLETDKQPRLTDPYFHLRVG